MQQYFFGAQTTAVFHHACCTDTLRSLWHGFCSRSSQIQFSGTEEMIFVLGEQPLPLLKAGEDFALSIGERGAAIVAQSRQALCRGYLTLLQRIRTLDLTQGQERFCLDGVQLGQTYPVKMRMVHLCVFPETTLTFFKKLVRVCGLLQYTHVIVEFWGTLRYDCLDELAWPEAYDKAQIRPIVQEIRDLGMEPVPMFNHLGHAAGSRLKYGKHVVLDQNPRLKMLFGEDGWTWNIANPRTLALLKQARGELYELFGPGEYVHIGVDEAYKYGWDVSLAKDFAAFLGEQTDEILNCEGRRPIIWGDMLLNKAVCGVEGIADRYTCLCRDQRIADTVFDRLDHRVIIADWQYRAVEPPLKTTLYLQSRGYDVLCCPWDKMPNVEAAVATARSEGVMGLMETTWHTLSEGALYALHTAAVLSMGEPLPDRHAQMYELAALFRCVSDGFAGYENCGWRRLQIDT